MGKKRTMLLENYFSFWTSQRGANEVLWSKDKRKTISEVEKLTLFTRYINTSSISANGALIFRVFSTFHRDSNMVCTGTGML